MCIYIRYNMSILVKAFHYEENEITVIKCRDEIWFRGKDIAKAKSGPPLRMSKGVQSL